MTRPRRPDCSWPLAALRTAALRTGFGNKAGGGRDTENQACKGPGRVRDGAQQDGAKVAGSMTANQFHSKLDQLRHRLEQVRHKLDTGATREGEDTPKLDQGERGDNKATREGEDTPELDQVERGNNEAQGAGLGGIVKGGAAEGATRRNTEA